MKRKKGPTAAEPLGNDQQQQQQQKKTNRNGQNHCAGPDSITTVVVGRDAMTSGWRACTMNVSRLPTSADYILWHGHQAPPHTHSTEKGPKRTWPRARQQWDWTLSTWSWWVRAPVSFFLRRRLDCPASGVLLLYQHLYTYIQAPSIGCHVGWWVGYTESLSSFFSEREIYIFTESCRLLTDRRTNPEHKPDWISSVPFALLSFSLLFRWCRPQKIQEKEEEEEESELIYFFSGVFLYS